MDLLTSANCKIHIGTTAAAADLASFEADDYTEVGSIEDAGEFGDTYNPVSASLLSAGRVMKGKGTADAGDMALVVAFDGSDEGQAAILAAAKDTKSTPYNIKVTLNDQKTPDTGNPTTFYFKALVMSCTVAIGGADNVIRRNVSLAITSEIFDKAAA